MKRVVIKGSGSYLPEKIVKGSDFLTHDFYDEGGHPISLPTEVIIKKFEQITEIEERRYITDDLMNSDIATIAAKKAIAAAGIDPEEFDHIIFGHNYGDVTVEKRQVDIMPSMAARVKHHLGIKNRKCIPYDMSFGCPGWVQSMILAQQLAQAGVLKKALIIGAETLSRVIDPHDRNSMIFADGAAAVVVEVEENSEKGFQTYDVVCDQGEEFFFIGNGKSIHPDYKGSEVNIKMKGRKVYEYVLSNVPGAIKSCIDQAGLHFNDVSKFLIHQANAKMDHAILERLVKLYDLEGDFSHKMPMTIQNFGNTSVATVPTMYDLIMNNQLGSHEINEGDYIVFASVGASMNINAILYKV